MSGTVCNNIFPGLHCCQASNNNLCVESEGDCDNDADCDGLLVCGNNNCLNWRPTAGLWDAEDDCCERRCTQDHKCVHGEVRKDIIIKILNQLKI